MVRYSRAMISRCVVPGAMRKLGWAVLGGLLGAAVGLAGQTAGAGASGAAGFDATGLVRRAVAHRLEEDKSPRPMRYELRRRDERRDTTKEIVETKDGDVARLVAMDGKPLSAEADRAELARLDALAAHPEMQEHRRRSEQKDQERVDHMMSLLPEALVYRLEGTEACGKAQCFKLSFAPNPRFTPPDMEAGVLRGVGGEIWIDQAQERLVRLDARFVANVDFGFGLLGKVNKGGRVVLEQAAVDTGAGAGAWELTGLQMNLTGKALMVKSLNFQVTEEMSGFAGVAPGMSYRDGIALLKRDAR